MMMTKYNDKLYRWCIDELCNTTQLVKYFKLIEKRTPIKFTKKNFDTVVRGYKSAPAVKYILTRPSTTFNIDDRIADLEQQMKYRPAKYKQNMYDLFMTYKNSRNTHESASKKQKMLK